MRLICPNCGAQYEVDDSVIPPEGRDVQCSSCGQTWFQPAAAAEAAAPPAPDPAQDSAPVGDMAPQALPEDDSEDEYIEDAVAPEPAVFDTPDPDLAAPASVVSFDPDEAPLYEFDSLDTQDATPEPAPAHSAEDDLHDAAETPVQDGTEAAIAGLLAGAYDDTPADDTPPAPRRALDENVVNVLREEAAHEQRARAAEENDTLFGGQREMGLQGAAVTALAGADEDGMIPREAGSRRDLLPDIEEINSTLRATSERHGQFSSDDELVPDHDLEPQSNAFARSFSLVIVLAGLLVALYIFAADLKDLLPAAAPALDIFTGGVDAGRLALDDLLRALVDKMSDAQGGGSQ